MKFRFPDLPAFFSNNDNQLEGNEPMKVKELIAELTKLDQNLEVCLYTEEEFGMNSTGVKAFDVVSIEAIAATRIRSSNGSPMLSILDAQDPKKLALIEITSDF